MLTGHTACIKAGVSFEEFAIGCACAFSAYINMRDDPSDAAVSEEFEPDKYYKDSLAKQKKRKSLSIIN